MIHTNISTNALRNESAEIIIYFLIPCFCSCVYLVDICQSITHLSYWFCIRHHVKVFVFFFFFLHQSSRDVDDIHISIQSRRASYFARVRHSSNQSEFKGCWWHSYKHAVKTRQLLCTCQSFIEPTKQATNLKRIYLLAIVVWTHVLGIARKRSGSS